MSTYPRLSSISYFDILPDDLYPLIISLISPQDYKNFCKVLNNDILLDIDKGTKFHKHVIEAIKKGICDYYLNPRGKKDGLFTLKYEDLILKEKFYISGKRQGIFRSYHNDGTLSMEGEYINGKRDGLFIWYYINGSVREKCIYLNGKKNGTHLRYSSMEDILESIEYKHGKKNGYEHIYRLDRLGYSILIQSSKYDNDDISYRECYDINGIKLSRSDYLSNVSNQESDTIGRYEHRTFYYPDGSIKTYGVYICNLLIGEFIKYDKMGLSFINPKDLSYTTIKIDDCFTKIYYMKDQSIISNFMSYIFLFMVVVIICSILDNGISIFVFAMIFFLLVLVLISNIDFT